jgi:hypothetical protein
MRKDAYSLIDACHNVDPNAAVAMYAVASEVEDSLLNGVSAIGNLMFWAAENDEYDGEQAKRDMFDIGCFLKHVSRMAGGVHLAAENLEHAARQAKKGVKS